MTDEPREFKMEVIEKDGKKMVNIKAQSEVIKHADGTQSVTIHAPALSLISEYLNMGGK